MVVLFCFVSLSWCHVVGGKTDYPAMTNEGLRPLHKETFQLSRAETKHPNTACIKPRPFCDARGFCGSGIQAEHSRCGVALFKHIWRLHMGRTEWLKMRTIQSPSCPPVWTLAGTINHSSYMWPGLPYGMVVSKHSKAGALSLKNIVLEVVGFWWPSLGSQMDWRCGGQSNHSPTLVQGMETKSLWPRLQTAILKNKTHPFWGTSTHKTSVWKMRSLFGRPAENSSLIINCPALCKHSIHKQV